MVTLADIAKKADVSAATVSRVLTNKKNVSISQPTVERIQKAAKELGYRPNALARALATGRTRTIGLYYHTITETMFIRILEAAQSRAHTLGYQLMVSSDLSGFATGSNIDGLVCIAHPNRLSDEARSNIERVFFVTPSGDAMTDENSVTWSEYDAAYLAVEHLVNWGHRCIGAVWGDFRADKPNEQRVAGFRDAAARGNVTVSEQFDERDPDLSRRGYLQMRRLLQEMPEMTAVFARNDYLAMGVLQAVYEAGISVPDQMSVIGYGDSVMSRSAMIPLTTISHPNAEATVIALDHMVEMIETGRESFPTIRLPITLCRRNSCGPPRNLSSSLTSNEKSQGV